MFSRYHLHRLESISQTILVKVTRRRCAGYSKMRPYLRGKVGIEFGGPSSLFTSNNLVPLYDLAARVDHCNFAERTLWTSCNVRSDSKMGQPLVMEASDTSDIADESYDFVAACHVLEHVANPLRALAGWKRILKPSGTILLVLPDKAGTFDHRRPYTTFEHLKQDLDSETSEDDLTHLQEILALHDLELDPAAGTSEQFRSRCLNNAGIRAMHHHVFSTPVLSEMFAFLDMEVINITLERPYHIVVHALKASSLILSSLAQ